MTGDCVISAVRDIGVGEEITISYIDEGQPLDERRADLADYGFQCRCARCTAGEAAGGTTTKLGEAVPRPVSHKNIALCSCNDCLCEVGRMPSAFQS